MRCMVNVVMEFPDCKDKRVVHKEALKNCSIMQKIL